MYVRFVGNHTLKTFTSLLHVHVHVATARPSDHNVGTLSLTCGQAEPVMRRYKMYTVLINSELCVSRKYIANALRL